LPFILDTNVAIHLRDGDPEVFQKVQALGDDVLLSIVTRVELEGGVVRTPGQMAIRRSLLDAMLEGFPTVPFGDDDADAYRRIVEASGYSRRKILDRMIAAQALVHRATLVTMNSADFADVPGLQLDVW
jgi:predicted nucleic acid-binding protein